jgi:hypothetical protein
MNRPCHFLTSILFIALMATPVIAQDGDIPGMDSAPAETAPAETAPAETAPAETAPAETAPAETAPAEVDGAAAQARMRDASIDRGFIVSHAETLPEGMWALNSYELVGIGLSYGITEDVEVSIISLVPIVAGMPLVAAPSVKWAFHRTEDQVLSAKLGLNYIGISDVGGGTFSAGLYHDFFFDPDGFYSMHLGVEVGGFFGQLDGSVGTADGAFLLFDLGFSAQLSDSIKLMAEFLLPAATNGEEFAVSPIMNVTYGIRWFGEGLSVDLGFLRPFGDEDLGDVLIMGVPYVAFSGRI